ncbi:MAG: MinD/ParA family protein [Candidatus Bathyarchaeia archaeon]
MTKRIAIHSFRGGTGKSNFTANLAVALSSKGKNVGTVDLDLKAPGLHVIFDVPSKGLKWRLNDYLFRRCEAHDIVTDLTEHLGIKSGRLHFIPASFKLDDVLRIIEKGYEVSHFNKGISEIADELNLDYLLIDNHPGIGEDVVLAISMSDFLVELMRIDQQDLTGAYISLAIASKLGKDSYLLINLVPRGGEPYIKELIEKTLNEPIIGVIPFFEDIMISRSKGVFSLRHPDHPYAKVIEEIAGRIITEL